MAAATSGLNTLLRAVEAGGRPGAAAALAVLPDAPVAELLPSAESLALSGFGTVVTYSRKVFIPLTQLCRDVCHYCTFAKAPRHLKGAYLSADEVLAIARAGAAVDCKEALFTLGDKPEERYKVARTALNAANAASTLEYLERMARLVLQETGLLPHLNPGVMDASDLQKLRPVSVSMGLMLESAAERLTQRGGPHFGSPDKQPARRLATLRSAGELRIPMTTGLLIGIGETRRERIESLLALRELHDAHGHLQELIIQNFRAKPGTRMANAPEPDLEEQLWTIAVARLLFGPGMSIQAPPNLQPEGLASLVRAGINDWGGVSPVTPDHVNPEAPWPHLEDLARSTESAGRDLVERLALTPAYATRPEVWTDPAITPRVRRASDSQGFARPDRWFAGSGAELPAVAVRWAAAARRGAPAALDVRGASIPSVGSSVGVNGGGISNGGAEPASPRGSHSITTLLDAARAGHALTEPDIVRLFTATGRDLDEVIAAADQLRHESVGDTVTYVINRNINYTNICLYHCGFCAFSKGRGAADLRGPAYNLELDEVARRTVEAAAAGATEVCLQGGIHPSFTGQTYLNIVRAVKEAVPWMHVHAFSPLEVSHGASTLGLPLATYLEKLRDAGLSTLPGTAAEILDDEIRDIICPDKLRTDEWLEVIGTAHEVGLRTTSTIMFGHVEQPVHWARHLQRLRALQARTGGITEFVPLGYVHMEAPLWRKGRTRSGPTFREAVLMHAVPRLVLHPLIKNIQTSWVKMGAQGAAICLNAGANDLGGTLMNESITRAAGGVHGQELDASKLQALAGSIGRTPRQRTTLYGSPDDELVNAELPAPGKRPLRPIGRWLADHRRNTAVLRLGYKASAEQFGPAELLEFATLAEQRGFDSVFISDHFQGWRHTGGHAPFSMAWLGAVGARTSRIVMGTSVLAPTFRYHPAIVAQAFATLGAMFPERVILGVGSGESLNEVPATGMPWPEPKERTARLKEAVALIRQLWSEPRVSFRGQYYRTEKATIYDKPDVLPPIYIAGAGPVMAKYAGQFGDGFICTSGKGTELYEGTLLPNCATGVQASGRAPHEIDMMIEVKVSFDTDPQRALDDTRHWGALALSPEEKSSVDDPLEMERLADQVPTERAAKRWIVSTDPDEQVERIRPYVAMGFRHLVFHAPGPDQVRFLNSYAEHVLPRLRAAFG